MSNIKCVHDEYQRLSASLGIEKLDESKKVLVEELVKQASFLLVELDILKEQIDTYGAIQVKGINLNSYYWWEEKKKVENQIKELEWQDYERK